VSPDTACRDALSLLVSYPQDSFILPFVSLALKHQRLAFIHSVLGSSPHELRAVGCDGPSQEESIAQPAYEHVTDVLHELATLP
jgi:hypothetical protein